MKKFSLFAICVMMCLLAGCEQNVPAISEPLVTTFEATQIGPRTVIIGGNVTDNGGSEVIERGICYSTSANPSISNKKIACGSGLGEFTCALTDLEKNTKYYVLKQLIYNNKMYLFANELVDEETPSEVMAILRVDTNENNVLITLENDENLINELLKKFSDLIG